MNHAQRRAAGPITAFALALTLLHPAGAALAGPAASVALARPPVVVRAGVDQVEPDRLVIRGRNFGVDAPPVVLLSDVPLRVLRYSNDEIVARLPLDAPPARYRLQVLTSRGLASSSFELTLGRRA